MNFSHFVNNKQRVDELVMKILIGSECILFNSMLWCCCQVFLPLLWLHLFFKHGRLYLINPCVQQVLTNVFCILILEPKPNYLGYVAHVAPQALLPTPKMQLEPIHAKKIDFVINYRNI